MRRILAFVAREAREVMPPTLLFLFLFHMIALTRAVALGDYSSSALRATTATVGALIVGKAILVVEALPLSRRFSSMRALQVLWKTLLFGTVALLFRCVEEIVPLLSKHGELLAATRAMPREIFQPIFWVLAVWLLGGLLLYSLASELARAMGSEKVKAILFGPGGG